MRRRGVVIVLSGFPRRSETFALNELLALRARGALAAVFATKMGDGLPLQPGAEALASVVHVLDAGVPEAQAAEVVTRLEGVPVTGIHAYFAHTPARVAAAAAERLRVPFGFSAHARDLRKVSQEELTELGRRAACVIACNTDAAAELRRAGVEPWLVPHGVDLDRFRPHPFPATAPFRLLAVGRLVPKKGFEVLVEVMARLPAECRLRVIGEGPERPRLEGLMDRLHVADRVELAGSATHAALPEEYAAAHAVVVPSVEDSTGDRDGLPNVILEAMACGRPVVASDIGATGSAVVPGRTGLLVPPGDPVSLAIALGSLLGTAQATSRMGAAARREAERRFDLACCTGRLGGVLGSAYA